MMINVKELPAPADLRTVERALISVFDKTGVVDFAKRLAALDIELLSTGGTARALRDAGLRVTDVSDLTGFPEILGGRVKTLHPYVHGALLARRNDSEDADELNQHGIKPIDLVVINLYPFQQVVAKGGVSMAEAIENIDIGGPTMIRAAAKNHFFVGVVTSPTDYDRVADTLEANNSQFGMDLRRDLAKAAFVHTATYDAAVQAYFESIETTGASTRATGRTSAIDSANLRLDLERAQSLRYGENPHQQGTLYGDVDSTFEQLHGKELSFNNFLDLSAAFNLIDEFAESDPTVAILKHTNPCGVGTAGDLAAAYARAFATDRQSPFGGIVVVNRELDLATAEAIDAIFTEIIIAPSFSPEALYLLQGKKNRRLIKMLSSARSFRHPDIRTVLDGVIVQERDPALPSSAELRATAKVATKREPTEQEWADLDFAWRVAKHVKSNAIVYARDGATLGIGAGQMSRIDASEIAVAKSRKSELDLAGSALASDAFFPFADGLLAAAEVGTTAVIQPGGSIRDEEVIRAADERGIAMVFTGKRHFRH